MASEHDEPSSNQSAPGWMSPTHAPGNLGVLLAMVVTAHGWWTYSGPYRWIADLQIMTFGGYQPTITGALTWLVATLAIAFPLKGLRVIRKSCG